PVPDERSRKTELLDTDSVSHVLPRPARHRLLRRVCSYPLLDIVEPHRVSTVVALRGCSAERVEPAQHVQLKAPIPVLERVRSPVDDLGQRPGGVRWDL